MSRLDSGATALIFAGMSVARELGRRLRADRAPPRYEPCLPRPAKEPPAGPGWIHEIKHDGFRIVAHRDGDRVRRVTANCELASSASGCRPRRGFWRNGSDGPLPPRAMSEPRALPGS